MFSKTVIANIIKFGNNIQFHSNNFILIRLRFYKMSGLQFL